MAKALADIDYEWPFDHNKPGVEDLYNEVVTNGKFENIKDSDVCIVLFSATTFSNISINTQIYIFPDDDQYYGYMVEFVRNKEKGIMQEILYRFIKRYKCQHCNQRFTNKSDRNHHQNDH